jgi:DegV family protein with EDD domain
MTKRIVTSDSTCAISRKDAAKIGLPILPLNVIIDGQEFHDGIDIDNDQLAKLMRGGAVVKTSTPTPVEIENFFNAVFAQGYDEIIHFTISSKLSSMFDLFTLTCGNLYGDKVKVFDSLSVCSFMGNHVLTAIELVKQGLPTAEVIKTMESRRGTEDIFFLPESLTYLQRGGRISPAVAAIGNLIGLKPVLAFKNGAVEKDGATRNIKKSIEDELRKLKAKKLSKDSHEIHVVVFDTANSTLEIVRKSIEKNMPDYDVLVTPISINVCAHTGPGTIGIGLNRKVNTQ